MRNYATAFFTRIDAYDDPYPTSLQQSWWIGLTQEAANNWATANKGIYSGFANVNLIVEGIRYLLLNRETIIGCFTTAPDAGTIAFKAFGGLATAEGLEPGTSPKHFPRSWPTSDGKRAKPNTQIGNVITPAVFDAIKVLQSFAAHLLRTSNLELQRIGNEINFELAKAFAGTKSIVAVFQTLQPFLDEA